MKLLGLGSRLTASLTLTSRQLEADGLALVAVGNQFKMLAAVGKDFKPAERALSRLANELEPRLVNGTTTSAEYQAMTTLGEQLGLATSTISSAIQDQLVAKLGKLEHHPFAIGTHRTPEAMAQALVDFAKNDTQGHSGNWNSVYVALPGEMLETVLARHQAMRAAFLKTSLPLKRVTDSYWRLAKETERPAPKPVVSRDQQTLVAAAKSEAPVNPAWGGVLVVKTPEEAASFVRWARSSPEALGGPPTEQALARFRENMTAMARKVNRIALWSTVLDAELPFTS